MQARIMRVETVQLMVAEVAAAEVLNCQMTEVEAAVEVEAPSCQMR